MVTCTIHLVYFGIEKEIKVSGQLIGPSNANTFNQSQNLPVTLSNNTGTYVWTG